jgi:DNA repair protein SbcD/Mre11
MAHVGEGGERRPPRQDSHLRLLLFSDLQLDRPYEWASPTLADARRAAAREALVEILGIARQRDVDVIACAGDLFDRRTVRPGTIEWLIAALRSASVPVLIAPGERDFVGPLGGYTRHEWPDNVTIFDTNEFVPVKVADGVMVWGAGHTEAHRARSFLDHFEVDHDGVNISLFHGAEVSCAEQEPDLDPSAPFEEAAVGQAGFDHALVGHYQQPHQGRLYTYPGAPLAHDFGNTAAGGVVLLTLAGDGALDREYLPIESQKLHDVSVDLTGSTSAGDVTRRVKASLGELSGVIHLRLIGHLSPDVVLERDDLVAVTSSVDDVLLDWAVDVDAGLDGLAEEQTVRGQFVRDVLVAPYLSEEQRQGVLFIGLRALAGSDSLEGPR